MTAADRWIWAVVAVLAALLVVCAVLLLVQVRGRRRDRAEVRELRTEVAGLAEHLSPPPVPAAEPEFVITDLGAPSTAHGGLDDTDLRPPTLSEPMVRVIAFGHGVRRALAPETRNRIRFEVRREVKRARKSRRREMRDAWREMKTRPVAPEEPGRDVA